MDAIPGRLNSLMVQLVGRGVFFGQCSELCGAGHGFMPIQVEVLNSLYNFYYHSLQEL
jgi:cytochrome c oxidase subunit 2